MFRILALLLMLSSPAVAGSADHPPTLPEADNEYKLPPNACGPAGDIEAYLSEKDFELVWHGMFPGSNGPGIFLYQDNDLYWQVWVMYPDIGSLCIKAYGSNSYHVD